MIEMFWLINPFVLINELVNEQFSTFKSQNYTTDPDPSSSSIDINEFQISNFERINYVSEFNE